jgi:uncharacterized C2H2 Zn-finger protein
MYICRRCGRVFKSRKAYIMHILLGIEGGYMVKGGRKSRRK